MNHISNVPLVDLQAQYRDIKSEINEAINGVLKRTDFILGEDDAFLAPSVIMPNDRVPRSPRMAGVPEIAERYFTSGNWLYLLMKLIKLGYKIKEIPCTKIYPAKRLGRTKMRPVLDWWKMLPSIFLVGLGLRK